MKNKVIVLLAVFLVGGCANYPLHKQAISSNVLFVIVEPRRGESDVSITNNNKFSVTVRRVHQFRGETTVSVVIIPSGTTSYQHVGLIHQCGWYVYNDSGAALGFVRYNNLILTPEKG